MSTEEKSKSIMPRNAIPHGMTFVYTNHPDQLMLSVIPGLVAGAAPCGMTKGSDGCDALIGGQFSGTIEPWFRSGTVQLMDVTATKSAGNACVTQPTEVEAL